MTILAGSAVLEPALAAGLRWDAGTEVRFEPGLSVSWYPGIPLTLEAGFRWTARAASEGGGTLQGRPRSPRQGRWAGWCSLPEPVSIDLDAEGITGDTAPPRSRSCWERSAGWSR